MWGLEPSFSTSGNLPATLVNRVAVPYKVRWSLLLLQQFCSLGLSKRSGNIRPHDNSSCAHAALRTGTKRLNQPTCLSVDERTSTRCSIPTMERFSALKTSQGQPRTAAWTAPGTMMSREGCRTYTAEWPGIPFTRDARERHVLRDREQICGFPGLKEEEGAFFLP